MPGDSPPICGCFAVTEQGRVRSPCVNVCALDAQDVCVGCYRSALEIAAWQDLPDEERREVLKRADARYRAAWESP